MEVHLTHEECSEGVGGRQGRGWEGGGWLWSLSVVMVMQDRVALGTSIWCIRGEGRGCRLEREKWDGGTPSCKELPDPPSHKILV